MPIQIQYQDGHVFKGPYGDVILIKRLGYKTKKTNGDPAKTQRHIGLFKCFCGKEFTHIINKIHSCGCGRTYNRKEYGESLYNAAIGKIRSHIKRRNIEISVTKEYLNNMIRKSCVYCGELGSNTSANTSTLCKSLKHNGIDRVDSSKGYIEGNCVPCCKRCNWAKNNMSVDEFKTHIIRIYNFMKLSGKK